MQLRVSAPGSRLAENDVDRIQKDLEKLDRRLSNYEEIYAEVRIQKKDSLPASNVTIELAFGRNHLIAKAEHTDHLQAVRAARDELIRQVNDRSRGGHSSFVKGR